MRKRLIRSAILIVTMYAGILLALLYQTTRYDLSWAAHE